MHHQLQLRLPWHAAAAAAEWLHHGQLQLTLVNAYSAAAGAFQLPCSITGDTHRSCGDAASSSSMVPGAHQQRQQDIALAVMLGLTKSCWVMGVYEWSRDQRPGAWLGVLGHDSSTCCSWSNTQLPALQPGEFLVPFNNSSQPASAITPTESPQAAVAAAGISGAGLCSVALSSRLFSRTGRHVGIAAGNQQKGVPVGAGAVCEVWQLSSPASRTTVSQAYAGKVRSMGVC